MASARRGVAVPVLSSRRSNSGTSVAATCMPVAPPLTSLAVDDRDARVAGCPACPHHLGVDRKPAIGTGRPRSTEMRASRSCGSTCSSARTMSAVGGPAWHASGSQGPRARSVGTNTSPSVVKNVSAIPPTHAARSASARREIVEEGVAHPATIEVQRRLDAHHSPGLVERPVAGRHGGPDARLLVGQHHRQPRPADPGAARGEQLRYVAAQSMRPASDAGTKSAKPMPSALPAVTSVRSSSTIIATRGAEDRRARRSRSAP